MFVFRQGCFYAAILQRCFVEGFIGAHGVVEVGFAGEFDGGVHGEHWHAAVDDFGAAFGEDVGDGAAATFVDFAELADLPWYAGGGEGLAEFGKKFGVGVVGAAFAAGACVFAERDAVTEKGDVALVMYVREGWIKRGGDVGGKDAGSGEGAAHGKLAVFAVEGEKLCEDVFEIARAHGGVADGADLFFVDEESDGGGLWRCEIQQRVEGGVCTGAVVVAVGGDESAIESDVDGVLCGNELELGEEQIFFDEAIFFVEQFQHGGFDRFFFVGVG